MNPHIILIVVLLFHGKEKTKKHLINLYVCVRDIITYQKAMDAWIFLIKILFHIRFFGEKTQKAMDDYIRKYNMKLCDTDENLINVYSDTEYEYSAGLINK